MEVPERRQLNGQIEHVVGGKDETRHPVQAAHCQRGGHSARGEPRLNVVSAAAANVADVTSSKASA